MAPHNRKHYRRSADLTPANRLLCPVFFPAALTFAATALPPSCQRQSRRELCENLLSLLRAEVAPGSDLSGLATATATEARDQVNFANADAGTFEQFGYFVFRCHLLRLSTGCIVDLIHDLLARFRRAQVFVVVQYFHDVQLSRFGENISALLVEQLQHIFTGGEICCREQGR